MVNYICERCGFISIHRGHFKRHLNRKHICNPIKNNISTEEIKEKYGFQNLTENEQKITENIKLVEQKITEKKQKITEKIKLECKFCKKKYSRIDYLNIHIKKYCKLKIESVKKKNYWKQLFEQEKKEKETILQEKETILQEKETILQEKETILQEKDKREKEKQEIIDKLIKQIETLLTKVGNTTNNTTINQNIIIRNLGEENLSYLTNNFFIRLIDAGPFASIPRIIKRIHFNEKHPENMNLKVTDKTQSHIEVYEENEWKIKDRKDTIKDIVNCKFELIDGKYEEVKNGLDDNKQRIYKKYKNRVETNSGIDSILEDTEKVVLDNN